MLKTLSVWLTDTRCPHYFVNNCNLLDNSFNYKSLASKLLFDEEHLSTWFINAYIGECARESTWNCYAYMGRQQHPGHIKQLTGWPTRSELQKAISQIINWRLDNLMPYLWFTLCNGEFFILSTVSSYSLTLRSCVRWMNDLTKIDERFSVYFSAVALLHVARKMLRNGFSDELINILSTILARNFVDCHSVLSRCRTEQNTSELVELLQKSAVEHLTTYRQLMARDFASVATTVTTDFEALYAYKRGDYQRCLQLSTQNVHTLLLYADVGPDVSTFPEFIQLLDDDIVSLTALGYFVNYHFRRCTTCTNRHVCITQMTLSLYLMTQCQLKLHHSVTSLTQTLDYIEVEQSMHPRQQLCERTLDHLTLKLIERKLMHQISHSLIHWTA